ncbi:MAG TPA: hypothetical protein PKD99_05035 [Sphingopyxis sp.]|nr:hypothetical protein [Sphingopyxis sp.]HMP44450.1 hypothetical protein [Sphingopyxis sp.]HMQ17808.1 hypothetical protein [Sphingopyxis sp.]
MRSWAILLAGLIVWAVHFFLLYGIGEFAGEGKGPRLAVLAITALALAVVAMLARLLLRAPGGDGFERWRGRLALAGLLLGGLAVLWQGLPALLAR